MSTAKKNPGKCVVNEEVEGVVMHPFDVRICGKEAEWMFEGEYRADPSTGECREGRKKCSESTKANQTVCIPNNKDVALECPINELSLVTQEEK